MTNAASFVLRPAQAGDQAAVMALVPRLRAFGPPPLRPAAALDAGERRTLERFFAAPPAGAELFIAEGPGSSVLGAAYAEPLVDYFTEESHGHLGILMVAEDAEGHGVGRALISVVEAWAADAGYRFVTPTCSPPTHTRPPCTNARGTGQTRSGT